MAIQNFLYQSEFKAPTRPTVQTPTATGCFSASPMPTRLAGLASAALVASLAGGGFQPTAPTVQTPTATGCFSQHPPQLLQPRNPGLDRYSFVSVAGALPTFSFSASPQQTKAPFQQQDPSNWYPPQSFAAPVVQVYVFSQDPQQTKAPFQQQDPSNWYAPQTPAVALTPSAFQFSQSPWQLARPRNPGLDTYNFISPAFVPPTLGFSQSPVQFRQPRNPGLDTYSFISPAFTLPTFSFSQSPPQFAKPRNPGLDRYNFVVGPFVPGPTGLTFSQSPEQFKRPFQPPDPANFYAPQTPSPLAPTPTAFQFSQGPIQLAKPRNPGLDAYEWGFLTPPPTTFTLAATIESDVIHNVTVIYQSQFMVLPGVIQITPTPSAFGFSNLPVAFKAPRNPGLDQYSFTSIFPLLTPKPLVFSQPPEQRLTPISPALMRVNPDMFTPIVALTPKALGFSQHPVVFAKARFPGLDQYSFVSIAKVVATPKALTFSILPAVFASPFPAALQQAVSWPPGVYPNVPPPAPQIPRAFAQPGVGGSGYPSTTPEWRTRSLYAVQLTWAEKQILLAQLPPADRLAIQNEMDEEDVAFLLMHLDDDEGTLT
jgi:hypothetical protein